MAAWGGSVTNPHATRFTPSQSVFFLINLELFFNHQDEEPVPGRLPWVAPGH